MNDLLSTIARVRRATSNRDIVTICDALEKALLVKADRPLRSGRFDRVAYQRDYMRKWRASKAKR